MGQENRYECLPIYLGASVQMIANRLKDTSATANGKLVISN